MLLAAIMQDKNRAAYRFINSPTFVSQIFALKL
jgi:hypothetical protein